MIGTQLSCMCQAIGNKPGATPSVAVSPLLVVVRPVPASSQTPAGLVEAGGIAALHAVVHSQANPCTPEHECKRCRAEHTNVNVNVGGPLCRWH